MRRIAALWTVLASALHCLSELNDGSFAEAAVEVNSARSARPLSLKGQTSERSKFIEIGISG